jgi:hypothetical protein
MSDEKELNVPKVGPVNKKAVIIIAGGGAAFVLWRFIQARQASAAAPAPAAADTTDDTSDDSDDSADLDSLDYGDVLDDGDDTNTGIGSYGFTGLTNSEWTQYAATQLEQDGTWSYTDIVTALGNYLNGIALTPTQQQIVSAALAVAGYPPVAPTQGSAPVGTTSTPLPAPSGLRASSTTQTSVALSWSAVSGASGYYLYRNGAEVGDVTGTTGTVSGLTAATSYQLAVAAYDVTGTAGSLSTAISVKTAAATSTTPTKPPTTPTKPTTPTPSTNVYPKRRKFHTVIHTENYSTIASEEKTGLTGEELFAYQALPQAGHSAAAAAKLKKQGANLLLAGQSVAIPYPK